jgi:hypothetical protein
MSETTKAAAACPDPPRSYRKGYSPSIKSSSNLFRWDLFAATYNWIAYEPPIAGISVPFEHLLTAEDLQ